jgi:hypothetical protein
VSLCGHVAAAIPSPKCVGAIWGTEMTRKSTAIALVGAATVALAPLAMSVPRTVYLDFASLAFAAVEHSYQTAPALVIVIAVALALPLLTVGLMPARSLHSSNLPANAADDPANPEEPVVMPGGQAYVEVRVGDQDIECALLRDMLRIGREVDNDIRIPSQAVHLYHAAIHREDDEDWHITDYSGTAFSHMVVNGRRCVEARLNDGDVIQLGPGRLRFHAGCV